MSMCRVMVNNLEIFLSFVIPRIFQIEQQSHILHAGCSITCVILSTNKIVSEWAGAQVENRMEILLANIINCYRKVNKCEKHFFLVDLN